MSIVHGPASGPAAEPRRPVALTVLLVMLALGNLAGVWKTTAGAEAFAAQFPRLSVNAARALVIVPIAFLLTLPWLWRMRTWAYVVQLAIAAAVVALDLWLGNRLHAVVTAMAATLLWALFRIQWRGERA